MVYIVHNVPAGQTYRQEQVVSQYVLPPLQFPTPPLMLFNSVEFNTLTPFNFKILVFMLLFYFNKDIKNNKNINLTYIIMLYILN